LCYFGFFIGEIIKHIVKNHAIDKVVPSTDKGAQQIEEHAGVDHRLLAPAFE
jgi:hypothetical protein